MANRSDLHASLPRRYKRMLALIKDIDEHQRGELRRLYISLAAHNRRIVIGRRAGKIPCTLERSLKTAEKESSDDQPSGV